MGLKGSGCRMQRDAVISTNYTRLGFMRADEHPLILLCCGGYRVGVPEGGYWREVLNSDVLRCKWREASRMFMVSSFAASTSR
jgi:hypothetical protein